MKYRILSVVLLSCLSLLMMSHSCSPTCENECSDHGTCLEGECFCDTGYYGQRCDAEILNDFPGTYSSTLEYTATDTSFTTTGDISLSVTDPANLEFSIGPVSTGNESHALDARASESWVFIPEQDFPEGMITGYVNANQFAPDGEMQLDVDLTLTTDSRTYQIQGTLSRPI